MAFVHISFVLSSGDMAWLSDSSTPALHEYCKADPLYTVWGADSLSITREDKSNHLSSFHQTPLSESLGESPLTDVAWPTTSHAPLEAPGAVPNDYLSTWT